MSAAQTVLSDWQLLVRSAPALGERFVVRGGGSKAFYGQPMPDATALTVLETGSYRGIVAYEPTELVITARAGTPLAEVEAVLAERGQMLACEPPHFGGAATVGGMVASGLSGPRRLAAGAVRDFVLGVRLLDGRGDILQFGGQVIKNVAGYDVSRLLTGSLGTLGVLLDVSLKVLPRPAVEETRVLELAQGAAIEHMNRWGGLPLPVTATAWVDNQLLVRLAGASAAVRAASAQIGGECLVSGDNFWEGLREQTHPFFATCRPVANKAGREEPSRAASLWRLALPTAVAPLDLALPCCIEWGGGQRWLVGAPDPARVRQVALRAGGHATLFRRGAVPADVPTFTPLPAPLRAIHQRLKAAFDPYGVFNPGRLYPDL